MREGDQVCVVGFEVDELNRELAAVPFGSVVLRGVQLVRVSGYLY